jgi:hypothetical protein
VRTAARLRPAAVRGWAAAPLQLEWRATAPGRRADLDLAWGAWLTAPTPIARYIVHERKHEVVAAVEPRECGRPRYESRSPSATDWYPPQESWIGLQGHDEPWTC